MKSSRSKASVEPRAVRRRQHRVAGDRSAARGSGRRPASRSPRAAPRPAARRRTRAGRAPGCARCRSARGPMNRRPTASIAGLGEHRAAGAVEVAGQQVEHVDRPLAERAEPLGRDAHPAVRRGPVRRGELAGDPADVVGRHPADRLGALRGERRRPRPRPRPALSTYAGSGGRAPRRTATWSIASSTTASVPGRTKWCSVGDLGGLGAARVEDDHPAAALLQSRSRFGKSGTVISEPLEAIGLAPKTRK